MFQRLAPSFGHGFLAPFFGSKSVSAPGLAPSALNPKSSPSALPRWPYGAPQGLGSLPSPGLQCLHRARGRGRGRGRLRELLGGDPDLAHADYAAGRGPKP